MTLHVLHLQREPADRPLGALEVGDEAAVVEIANVLVAFFDLPSFDLLLQIPNLKAEAAEPAGRSRLPCWTNCRSWTQEENAARPPLGYRLRLGVFSSQRKSIAAHSPSVTLRAYI